MGSTVSKILGTEDKAVSQMPPVIRGTRGFLRCRICDYLRLEELPPLWTGLDCWPDHCGEPMQLLEVDRKPENWVVPLLRVDAVRRARETRWGEERAERRARQRLTACLAWLTAQVTILVCSFPLALLVN